MHEERSLAGRTHALAAPFNRWSQNSVHDARSRYTFQQQEIPYTNAPNEVVELMKTAFERSGDGGRESVEYGFFLAEHAGGTLTHSFCTSWEHDVIKFHHLDVAFDDVMRRASLSNVVCPQFYHTHPQGASALTISSGDMTAAVRMRMQLDRLGVKAPLDFHAMPYDLAKKRDGVFLRITVPSGCHDASLVPTTTLRRRVALSY